MIAGKSSITSVTSIAESSYTPQRSFPPPLLSKKGLVTYIENRERGTILRLGLRTWAFVPKLLVDRTISYGNILTVEGVMKNNGRKDYIYVQRILQSGSIDFDKEFEKLNKKFPVSCYNKSFAVYLSYMGGIFKKFLKWPETKRNIYSVNPYKLFLNNHTDFYTAKALADVLGLAGIPVAAAIKHILNLLALDGRNSVPFTELCEMVKTIVPDATSIAVSNSMKDADAVYDTGIVWQSSVYYARKECLKKLSSLLSYKVDYSGVDPVIRELDLLSHKYCAIVGPAGSGKTTIIKKLMNIPGIKAVAMTGKAAQILNSVTLHSILGFGKGGFKVRKLPYEILVIDEASMIDWKALRATLRAVERVIFVGDLEQLKPVGSEYVFKELVARIPVISLTKTYRQNNHSVEKWITDKAIDRILTLYNDLIKTTASVQIISPLVVGPLGTVSINAQIQRMLYGTTDIVPGTRVICTDNIYNGAGNLVCANGLVGTVREVKGEYIVMDTEKGSKFLHRSSVELAYALSAYKCQGSEYDYVIAVYPSKVRNGFVTDDIRTVMMSRARKKTYTITED